MEESIREKKEGFTRRWSQGRVVTPYVKLEGGKGGSRSLAGGKIMARKT